MAVAWITPALADLNSYLVGAQVTAVNTAALATGQTDRFTRVNADTVLRIRTAIESGGYTLSLTAGTVPPELRDVWAYLVIAQLQSSIPALKLTEDQRRLWDDAIDRLKQIATGKLAVSDPLDPQGTPTAQTGGSIETIAGPTRQHTRAKMAGL